MFRLVAWKAEKNHAKVMEVVLSYIMASCKVLSIGVINVAREIDQASIQKFVNFTIGLPEKYFQTDSKFCEYSKIELFLSSE